MPNIQYITKRFSHASRLKIQQVNEIIAEYQAQGYTLTLRQAYYQMVSRDLIPNTQKSYSNLGSVVSDARLAGLMDWDAIEDRTRHLRQNAHWDSPADIIQACARQYQVDKWAGQHYRPEVWIEKDALIGVIEGVCEKWDVPYFSCRGYTSQSEMWRAARRLERHISNGQTPVILHLGDHDPSGRDMSRDIQERLETFISSDLGEDCAFDFYRLALNMDQIEEYNPPPNPAKITDSRANAYIAQFGYESWELDALEPRVIAELIDTHLGSLCERNKRRKAVLEEDRGRALLQDVAKGLQ